MNRIRTRIAVMIAVIFGVIALPTLALAATDTPPPASLEVGAESAFHLDAALVAIIMGVLIPLVNGLVTKLSTSTSVKVGITLALSAVAGVVNTSMTDGGDALISQASILNAVMTFIMAFAAYGGVYKPLELTSSPVTVVKDGVVTTEAGKLANVGVK